MTLGTRLLTWLRGELVGTDSDGNRYYRDRGAIGLARVAAPYGERGAARRSPSL